METTNVTKPENVQGMFLCWLQVSRRMEKTMSLAEWELKNWLLENAVHCTIPDLEWPSAMKAIRERVSTANAHKNADDAPLDFRWSRPDEVSSGYIRIEREGDPKAVMNIPVIDWRGNFMPCSI